MNEFEKQELENKLKGFQAGKDYSVSPAEDGKQVYNIHSEELKKVFGSNLVYCRLEKYDGEDHHYRGRFEGYSNGGKYSHQVWWSGENLNPETHPLFKDFGKDWENFFGNLKSFSHEIGNVHENWRIRDSFNFFNQDVIKSFRVTTTKFGPSSLNQTNKKKQLGIGHEEQTSKKYCANHECWNVDKAFSTNDNYCQHCGQFLNLVATDSVYPRKITNQPESELGKTRQFELEQQAKDQAIANLEEQNKVLNQQLAQERQIKEEAKRQAQQERDKFQNELRQLREELNQAQEKLSQLQEELKTKLAKTSDSETEKGLEQLTKTQQGLAEVNQLAQKNSPDAEELDKIKGQLDNSQQVIAAVAAHQQAVSSEKPLSSGAEIKPAPKPTKNHVPYLVGGLAIFGIPILVWVLWRKFRV